MNRISIRAVVIAFVLELGLDQVIQTVLFLVFGRGTFTSDMNEEQLRKAAEVIMNGSGFQLAILVLGTATTIAGGYLAARLAKTFPYYNGLAMGIVGFVFGLFFWRMTPVWLTVVGTLTCVPAAIYGAHIAKGQMSAVE
jgi:hypothetical protein